MNKNILISSVNTLCKDFTWFAPLSPLQKFCWGVVATVCRKISIIVVKNFESVLKFQFVIKKLGFVFKTYCQVRSLSNQQCLLSLDMPKEIDDCQSDDVRNYFYWVRNVQDLLKEWQKKFLELKVNYDEILQYVTHCNDITALGQAVCANSYIMKKDEIEKVKEKYVQCFNELNVDFIYYVQNHPEVKYCTLLELVNKYGVSLPSELQKSISHKIIFPSDKKVPIKQNKYNLQPPVSGFIESGRAISLILTESMPFVDLDTLRGHIHQFLEPVREWMDMFVFFHLHGSKMFEKHLFKRLHILTATSLQNTVESFSLMPPLMSAVSFARKDPSNVREKEGVSINTLQQALQGVNDLLLNVIEGTATYSDINANGALQLETLNTETEFDILKRFSETLKMNSERCNGLKSSRCLLELFHFTHYINEINRVCHQYGLTECLKDDTFEKLMNIVEELKSEQAKTLLTPDEATEKVAYLKEALCLDKCSDYSCLDLFPAIANSVAFYQFIRDKQFIGTRGQIMFQEQYQLITAQLQHEEYDENVLNHLRAAFELIAPFMEQDITFSELMNKVLHLKTTHGLKQLETVNEPQNIMLIRLWFTRAEVRHITIVCLSLCL